jgi:cellulose synthase/poly-beta-1,6-N-acetylglucosamine synthase-like glycosyltransferase
VGLLYLAYDTWLLGRLISLSRRAVNDLPRMLSGGVLPDMTVLVPARNESAVLPDCLDALLGEGDSSAEIWVIDDGSDDDTVSMLAARYGIVREGRHGHSTRHPNLHLWSKPSSGKADSFNQILPDCHGGLIVTIDADTVIEPGSLRGMASAFADDPNLAAACGILDPVCRGGRLSGYFSLFQRFEYVRAFLWRLAWSRLDALVLVSGAFAAYRRDVLEKLQGFDSASWVEDYELLYRLHRVSANENLGWRVRSLPGARARTDAPVAVDQFLRQRARWFGGFLSTLFANRDMVGAARYGGVGHHLLPVKTVDTLLPLFAAAAQISLIFLIVRGSGPGWPLVTILGLKLSYDLIMHLWAMRLYSRWLGQPMRAGWIVGSLTASVLEPFCFQPLRYSGAIAGWVAFLRRRLVWTPQRVAMAAEPASEGG